MLHIFDDSNILYLAVKSLKCCHSVFLLFDFSCFTMSLNECPSFIYHDFIFWGKMALQPSGYAEKTFAVKMLVSEMLTVKILDMYLCLFLDFSYFC